MASTTSLRSNRKSSSGPITEKQQHEFLGRNLQQWAQLAFYYPLFLFLSVTVLLVLLYTLMLSMITPTDLRPPTKKWESHNTPRLSFVSLRVNLVAEPIIWYTTSGKDSLNNRRYKSYTKSITEFINEEKRKCQHLQYSDCPFKLSDFGPCGLLDFGYINLKPCIFVKLTGVPGWHPWLDNPGKKLASSGNEDISQSSWIECSGSNGYFNEHLGEIKYFPGQAFKDSFFPFRNGVSLTPVIAIQLENIDKGYILEMKCNMTAEITNSTGIEAKVFVYIEDNRRIF